MKRENEVRTPDQQILLLTYEDDSSGKRTYIAKKGKRQERLSLETLMNILLHPAECKGVSDPEPQNKINI